MSRTGWQIPPSRMPERAFVGGFIYVIGFDNGTVKVGSTVDPAARFKAHAGDASAFNVVIADWWISVEHDDYQDTEDKLIAATRAMRGTRSRREYFHGLQFEDVMVAAKNIVQGEGTFAYPRQNQRGERLFPLHEVNRRCGFFAVEWLLESCRDGSIGHSLVDGRYYMSERDIDVIVDRHLGPNDELDNVDVSGLPNVDADLAWICGISTSELRRRIRRNEPLLDSVELVRV